MTLDQTLAFVMLAGMMGRFVWGRVRYDLVAVLAILLSVLPGTQMYNHREVTRITVMSELTPLFPRQMVPALELPLAGGATFELLAENPSHFLLLAPRFVDMPSAIDFVVSKDYPARGEVVNLPKVAAYRS